MSEENGSPKIQKLNELEEGISSKLSNKDLAKIIIETSRLIIESNEETAEAVKISLFNYEQKLNAMGGQVRDMGKLFRPMAEIASESTSKNTPASTTRGKDNRSTSQRRDSAKQKERGPLPSNDRFWLESQYLDQSDWYADATKVPDELLDLARRNVTTQKGYKYSLSRNGKWVTAKFVGKTN